MDDLSGRDGDQRCFRGVIGLCQIEQVLQQAECEFGIEVVVCDPVMLAPAFYFDEDIVKKNAIMMIDFALDAERHRGLAPEAAIFEACLLRFRPIMMTTMAALLGALPLAIGMGDGSELRRPLGVSIVGGLIFSQALTLYTTPVIYLYIDRFRLWSRRTWGQRFLQTPDEPLAGTILGSASCFDTRYKIFMP